MANTTEGTVDPEYSRLGKFDFGFEAPVSGQLRIAGRQSSLHLQDELCLIGGPSKSLVTGVLQDGSKVTLIECVSQEQMTRTSETGVRSRFVRMFPHFILEGLAHVDPQEANISRISFGLEHASALFYDFDAFGRAHDAKAVMELIASSDTRGRTIEIGENPEVVYFTGKFRIVDIDIALGRLSVEHNPSWGFGGENGVNIQDFISVRLGFPEPINFDESIERLIRLLRFLELVVGHPQRLLKFRVVVSSASKDLPLDVHWSHGPGRGSQNEVGDRSPHPGDILLDAIRRQEEFVTVIRRWFDTDVERRDARQRFDAVFARQRTFDEDRLIGAANMFDLLPESAVPSVVPLSDDLAKAKAAARATFKALPPSIERNSMLDALRRLGEATLKHKVKHRAELILSKVPPTRFPKLLAVLEAAVDCRNHYVHGAETGINYRANFNLVVFFTDTLEFVFGASELVEAGWDVNAFIAKRTCMTHPYGTYLVSYKNGLALFESAIPPKV